MADRHDITFGDGYRTSGRRLNNWTATTSPTAYDGSSAYYEVGSRWLDTIEMVMWTCLDDTAPDAAIWVAGGGPGSGGGYAGDYVVPEIEYGLSPSVGASGYFAHDDHTHGSPPHDNYHHNQLSADTTWTIDHNLGRHPVVSALDSAGSQIECSVSHTTVNQVVLTLSYSISGTADLA